MDDNVDASRNDETALPATWGQGGRRSRLAWSCAGSRGRWAVYESERRRFFGRFVVVLFSESGEALEEWRFGWRRDAVGFAMGDGFDVV